MTGTDAKQGAVAQATAAYGAGSPEVAPTAPAIPPSATPLLSDRDQYLSRVDHQATVARMRTLLPAAAVGWIAFFGLDVVFALWVFPTDVMPFALLRLAGLAVLLSAGWILRRVPHPSEALTTGLDVAMMATTAGCLTVMGLLAGGVSSPYHAFVVLVLLGRAAVAPHRWQEALWRLAIPVAVNLLILAAASLAAPSIRMQWLDSAARGGSIFFAALLIGSWTLVVAGSHHAWALRRQVFASRSLGRFKLKTCIGRGGMGEVWVARDEELRRDVALKVLRPQENDQEAVQRFEREIRATAALQHPNTIRIFSHGVSEDGLWFYAMERLEGESLQELVARVGPLSPPRAAHLIRQAARALSEAHGRGIIHRDIKPENLFVTTLGGEHDVTKVLDFGIVRETTSGDPGLTATGFIAGTPAYMAPEVAVGGDASPASDVYALGATLFFALTGAPPFGGPDAGSVMRQHVNTPTPSLADRTPAPVSAELEQICQCALAKRPADRFASTADFAAALARLSQV